MGQPASSVEPDEAVGAKFEGEDAGESVVESSEVTSNKPKVDYSDFLTAREGGTAPKKTAEEAGGGEMSTQDDAEGEQEQTEEVKLKREPAAPKPSRDYSVFDEADRPLFQKTSNDAFERIKGIVSENKKLKEDLAAAPKSTSFHGHERAYTLTDEYQQRSWAFSKAEELESHWERQLINIKKGQKWQDAEFDAKTGKIVLSEPKEADIESELMVQKALRHCSNQTLKIQNGLESYETTFKSGWQNATKQLDEMQKRFLPGFEAPNHVTKKIQEATISKLPPEFRDHPLAKQNAMLVAAMSLMNEEIQELRGTKAKAAAIKKDSVAAGPTKSRFINGKASANQVKFSDYALRRELD
jgi:hypothetical protein